MAGRNYLPPEALRIRDDPLTRPPHPHSHPSPLINDPRHRRVPLPPAALLEDRLAAQHREIQALLLDNQRLAATHVELKQDLAGSHQELRRLAAVADSVKAEKEAEVRQVYERSVKAEEDARSVDKMGAELNLVREDIKKLNSDRAELTEKLRTVEADFAGSRSELREFQVIKAEIEAMQKEVQRGRAAIEYEKKMQTHNLEQSQAMEKSMNSMAHEIEKLRAELANAEKRKRAAAAAAAAANPSPGYAPAYGNPETGYGAFPYPHSYAAYQVQSAVDAAAQYGAGPLPYLPVSPYDPQTHVYRKA